ncbi:MAG: DUF373 family protein [Candidatus Aenigmarchaeota archaeon]|nr:DUF373 family protein [Candidatus Aenigmarchaeota archaeon]
MAKDKILVLSVDRDDDIGAKAGIRGPIVGREAVLKAATAFAIADPEDSDANAIFQALKMYEEAKKQYTAEVAVLTGHEEVGLRSDKIIADQLARILKKFPATGAIFVSDGAEDEHILPIVQSRVPIISVRRVVVRQSEELESGYYKIKDFLKESMDNPKVSRIVFGIPAIVLILLWIFGIEGFRIVLGLLGVYLLIKGFKFERYLMAAALELQHTLAHKRFLFFLYIMSVVFLILGAYNGVLLLPTGQVGLFEAIASFTSGGIFLFYLAATVVMLGRSIAYEERTKKKMLALTIFGFSIAWVIYNAAELIINPDVSGLNFFLSIVGGFALIFVALVIEMRA